MRELLDDTATFAARVESYRAGLSAGQPVAFDFSGIAILTQSVLHALLVPFGACRLGDGNEDLHRASFARGA